MAATNKAVGTASRSFEIVIIESDGTSSVIPLGMGTSTIGSDPSCHILIADGSVAGKQAELLLEADGSLWIRDLAGQQNTLVNGQITEHPAGLEDGSFIKVGLVDLSVRERGANSGMHGTMIRDSSANNPALEAPAAALPPPAVTPLRQSTVQRAYKTGPNPPSPSSIGRSSGVKPIATLSLEDDDADGVGTDPTSMRGFLQKEEPEVFKAGATIGGRYKILSKLAEGGMGEVYKAEHIQLEMQVAIKVMRPELGDDAAFVDRFTREAKAASRIGQQNICSVTDMARTPSGQFYFVMEYLEGQTLGARIRDRGALPIATGINIFMQLCQALASAHHVGIVHRDLKPENVMILQRPGQPDFVKVLDFGVAKLHKPNENGATQVGMVVGTPQYMAPEQASGLLTDQRTDIYALGLIFYEMLAGKPTFSEATASLLMAAQIYRTPAPLQFASGDAMPEHVQNFVGHMLQKKAENRPQDMDAVINALQALQEAFKAPVKLLATPAYTPPVRPSDVAALIESDKRKSGSTGLGSQSGIKLKPPSSGQHRANAMPPTPGDVPSDASLEAADYAAVQSQKNGKGLIIGGAIAALVLVGAGGYFVFGGKEPPPVPAVVEIKAPTPPPVEARPPPPEVKAPPVEVKPAGPIKVHLKLVTDPSGAEILKDGATIGNSPMDLPTEEGKTISLSFKLAGFKEEKKTIAPVADTTIEVRLSKAGGGGGPGPGPAPKKKPGKADLADDPYGGQTEDLKDAPF